MSFKKTFDHVASIAAQAGLSIGAPYKYAEDVKFTGMARKTKAADIVGTDKKFVVRYEKVAGMRGEYDVFVFNAKGTGFSISLYNPNIEQLKKFVKEVDAA